MTTATEHKSATISIIDAAGLIDLCGEAGVPTLCREMGVIALADLTPEQLPTARAKAVSIRDFPETRTPTEVARRTRSDAGKKRAPKVPPAASLSKSLVQNEAAPPESAAPPAQLEAGEPDEMAVTLYVNDLIEFDKAVGEAAVALVEAKARRRRCALAGPAGYMNPR